MSVAPEPPKTMQTERCGTVPTSIPPRAMNVEPPKLNDNNPPVARPQNERKNLKYIHYPPRENKTSRPSSISSWSSSRSLAPALVLLPLDFILCLTRPLDIQRWEYVCIVLSDPGAVRSSSVLPHRETARGFPIRMAGSPVLRHALHVLLFLSCTHLNVAPDPRRLHFPPEDTAAPP